jgi:hypothetical protein
MRRKRVRSVSFWMFAALWLAACSPPAVLTPAPTTGVSPTSPGLTVETITKNLATAQPADVLLELAWEGGFTRPELAHA